MKIDVNQYLTLGAKRTLKAFRMAIFEALTEQEFNKITVNDICKKSEYPRATFYNYFDDKLDLLHYLWAYIGKDILKPIPKDADSETGLITTFNTILNYFHENRPLLENIQKYNGVESHLWHNTSGYLKHEINTIIFQHFLDTKTTTVPIELLSRFYSDLIIGLLEWCLFEQPDTDTKQADDYLIVLLHGNI